MDLKSQASSPKPAGSSLKPFIACLLAAFFALAFVAWPSALEPAKSMFNSGDHSWPKRLLLMYSGLSILSFPLYWSAGFWCGWESAGRGRPFWRVLLASSIPLLSAMWPFVVPAFVYVRWVDSQSDSVEHPARELSSPRVYDLGDKRLAVENENGYFMDPPPGKKPKRVSAWIVDLNTDRPDRDGIIYLGPDNLDREFFVEHDREDLLKVFRKWQKVPADEEKSPYVITYNRNRSSGVTLITPEGDAVFLRVKQD